MESALSIARATIVCPSFRPIWVTEERKRRHKQKLTVGVLGKRPDFEGQYLSHPAPYFKYFGSFLKLRLSSKIPFENIISFYTESVFKNEMLSIKRERWPVARCVAVCSQANKRHAHCTPTRAPKKEERREGESEGNGFFPHVRSP